MAIIDAAQTTAFVSEYSENLFSNDSNFDNEPAVNITSGSMVPTYSDEITFDSGKSIYLQPTSYNSTDVIFNFGTALQYTIKNTGSHIFSIRLLNPNTTVMFFVPFVLRVKLWKNAVNTDEFVINSVSDLDIYSEKWVTWAQSFDANFGDVIDFSFQIDADLSYPFPNINFWMDALKLELDDRFLGTPSIYSKPLESLNNNETGYQSRTDTTNTQVLTLATDNLVSFTGTLSENGGLVLMDSNAKITPIQAGDVLTVDFAFTGVVPAGANLFLTVFLKVNGVVYRAVNKNIIKGVGLDDYFSVSWVLPVEVDFFTYGAEVYVNPLATMTIKDRYINCTRTHKYI